MPSRRCCRSASPPGSTGHAVSFPAVEVGRHRLADLLADRAAVLLVVDDIWDAEVLGALNVVGAPRGALLFTTRDAASYAPPARPSGRSTSCRWSRP